MVECLIRDRVVIVPSLTGGTECLSFPLHSYIFLDINACIISILSRQLLLPLLIEVSM